MAHKFLERVCQSVPFLGNERITIDEKRDEKFHKDEISYETGI